MGQCEIQCEGDPAASSSSQSQNGALRFRKAKLQPQAAAAACHHSPKAPRCTRWRSEKELNEFTAALRLAPVRLETRLPPPLNSPPKAPFVPIRHASTRLPDAPRADTTLQTPQEFVVQTPLEVQQAPQQETSPRSNNNGLADVNPHDSYTARPTDSNRRSRSQAFEDQRSSSEIFHEGSIRDRVRVLRPWPPLNAATSAPPLAAAPLAAKPLTTPSARPSRRRPPHPKESEAVVVDDVVEIQSPVRISAWEETRKWEYNQATRMPEVSFIPDESRNDDLPLACTLQPCGGPPEYAMYCTQPLCKAASIMCPPVRRRRSFSIGRVAAAGGA